MAVLIVYILLFVKNLSINFKKIKILKHVWICEINIFFILYLFQLSIEYL